MESDSREPGVDRTGSGPDADEADCIEARATLDALDADAAQLAARIVTPWWYHPALGALVALCIAAVAFPGLSPAVFIPFLVISMPALLTLYTSRYGISVSRSPGRRSRRALLLSLAVLVVLLVVAVLLGKSSLSSWWGLLPTVAAFGATVVLGRRYDAVLRAEVAAPGGHR